MITVNGKNVAGVGPAGLSPYQVAVSGGYSGTEEEFNETLTIVGDLNSKLDAINGEVVGTTSVEKIEAISDGKSAVAAAITTKGVETAADATFQQMADNIGQIQSGGLTPNTAPDEIINIIKTYGTLMDLTGENEGKRVIGDASPNPPFFVGAYLEVSPAYADQYKSQCLFGYGGIGQISMRVDDAGLQIQGGGLFYDNYMPPVYTKLYAYGFDNLHYE